jgi:hypothetical protein
MSQKDGKNPFERFYAKKAGYANIASFWRSEDQDQQTIWSPSRKLTTRAIDVCSLVMKIAILHDTFRVLGLKNKTVVLTRNVRWLGKTYGDYKKHLAWSGAKINELLSMEKCNAWSMINIE